MFGPTTALPPPTAAILAIGDEVLRGEVTNGNAAFLSQHLFDLGFALTQHLVVSDDPADIRSAFESLTGPSGVDVLLVTGGLGPTEDDRTLDVLTRWMGTEVRTDEASLTAMKRRFEISGFTLTPNNLRQVRIPANAEVLPNAVGIAPGFLVRKGRCQLFFFPGVPREMHQIFSTHVIPRLQSLVTQLGLSPAAVRTFHVLGMGESHIDDRLAGLLDGTVPSGTQVGLHFRTAAPENHVKLVIRGADSAANQAVLDALSHQVHERLGDVIYGEDADTLPIALGKTLQQAGLSLAFAESCTGGMAGELVTNAAGASSYFRGAVVAYSNEIKQQVLGVDAEILKAHGAVSEPCAAAMAIGARRVLGSDIGVAITGIAGSSESPVAAPDVPGEKPIGTVCFAIADATGVQTFTKKFSPGRERIRRAAAFFALDLARRQAKNTRRHHGS